MNTDHIFRIGNSHKICEDYALSDVVGNTAYAIVADGCSSALESDVGARIVATQAREVLLTDGNQLAFITSLLARLYKFDALFSSARATRFESTLIVAKVSEDVLRVCAYGDGLIYLRRKNGNVEYRYIESPSNAPDYLSYLLDKKRHELYLQHVEGQTKKVQVSEDIGGYLSIPPFQPVMFETLVEQGDIVSIASDGIGSFCRDNRESIPWIEIAKEFFGFKNTNGEFVQRRILAFERQCKQDLTTHYDDISVASIVI